MTRLKPFFLAVGISIGIWGCQSTSQYHLTPETPTYQSHDLTAENLFSHNIEGPAFRNDTLFVVNYQKDGTIGMVLPNGKVELYVTLPEGSIANSIKFDKAGNMYLADFMGHNILKVDQHKNISVFAHNDKFNQPNDIVMTATGTLYASDPNWAENTGKIWLIRKDGTSQVVADQMGTTNGITVSPDGHHLFVGESVQRKIWKFDISEDGTLTNKRLFTEFKDFGMDGLHFAYNGNLFVCRYDKGVIAVFNSDGKLLREIPLTGKQCSNLVFGDPDMKTVFVTLQDRKGIEMFRID